MGLAALFASLCMKRRAQSNARVVVLQDLNSIVDSPADPVIQDLNQVFDNIPPPLADAPGPEVEGDGGDDHSNPSEPLGRRVTFSD